MSKLMSLPLLLRSKENLLMAGRLRKLPSGHDRAVGPPLLSKANTFAPKVYEHYLLASGVHCCDSPPSSSPPVQHCHHAIPSRLLAQGLQKGGRQYSVREEDVKTTEQDISGIFETQLWRHVPPSDPMVVKAARARAWKLMLSFIFCFRWEIDCLFERMLFCFCCFCNLWEEKCGNPNQKERVIEAAATSKRYRDLQTKTSIIRSVEKNLSVPVD